MMLNKVERNTYFSEVFSAILKQWCKENKTTQENFADAAGVHPNMISRYKKGEAYPTEEVIEKMCTILKCSKKIFIPVNKKEKTLAEYTTDELLAELKRRMKEAEAALERMG